MPENKKADKAAEGSLIEQPRRYRILSGGISTPTGSRYKGDVIAAEDLGDPARVAALLSKKAIEEVRDAANG